MKKTAYENYVTQTKNAMQSFVNEECRIAVEQLEGHVVDDLTISQSGVINFHKGNVLEFVWKGKIAIIFRPEETINGIELVAHHTYDSQDKVTFSESQDI